jgi:hypothetical protein
VTTGIALVLGYYVVALAGFTAWTYSDHGRTRRLVEDAAAGGDGLADRFALRVSIVLGALAAIGAGLLLALLLEPAPAFPIVLGVALVDGLVTFGVALIVLRSWGRWFRTDLLSDLRPAAAAVSARASERRDHEAPSGEHTEP